MTQTISKFFNEFAARLHTAAQDFGKAVSEVGVQATAGLAAHPDDIAWLDRILEPDEYAAMTEKIGNLMPWQRRAGGEICRELVALGMASGDVIQFGLPDALRLVHGPAAMDPGHAAQCIGMLCNTAGWTGQDITAARGLIETARR